MKSNEITISPLLFEGKLIIALDTKWIEFFGCTPKFKVFLNEEKRLIIQGPIIQQPKEIKFHD